MSEEEKQQQKTANTQGTKKKSNGNAEKKGPKRRNVPVTIDMTEDEIIQLSQEEGVTLFFDPNNFKELSSEAIDQLGFYSAQSYFQAKSAWQERKRREEQEKPLSFEDLQVLDPLSGAPSDRTKLRKREGWHQTWKRPDEYESAREKGFQEIRENKKGEEKEPGYEKGEVIKLKNELKETELIAMEIPEDVYNEHLKAVSDRVRYRKGQNMENLQETAERASYDLGKKNGVQVKDFSGDESGWREI